MRQGPHQSAKKSITTSLSPLFFNKSFRFFCKSLKPQSIFSQKMLCCNVHPVAYVSYKLYGASSFSITISIWFNLLYSSNCDSIEVSRELLSQKIKDEINRAMSFAHSCPGFASYTRSFVQNHRESVGKKKTLIPKVHEAFFVNRIFHRKSDRFIHSYLRSHIDLQLVSLQAKNYISPIVSGAQPAHSPVGPGRQIFGLIIILLVINYTSLSSKCCREVSQCVQFFDMRK